MPAGETHALVDHLREPVVLADADRTVVCSSTAAEQMLGSARHELIGRPLAGVLPDWSGAGTRFTVRIPVDS